MAERRNATETYVQTQLGLYVPKSLYDANSILIANSDDTPLALVMAASTIVARLASGGIVAATPTQIAALLTDLVPKSLYDANTVLAATTDDTPAAITMAASTILARLASGNIVAATVAQIATLLAQSLPGYQWDYKQITTSATSTATSAATATTAINGNSVTYDGTQVRIIFNAPAMLNSAGAPTASAVDIWRDSTDLGQVAIVSGSNILGKTTAFATILDTPSAGAHTYSIRHWVSGASTSTIQCGAGGAGVLAAAEMRVVKV